MSVLCWRDGVLAADSQVHWGDLKSNDLLKVTKFEGHLIGYVGSSVPSFVDMIDWYFDGYGEKKREKFEEGEFSLLVVTPKGDVEWWNSNGLFDYVKHPFWADGSGAPWALGAMEMGASAKEAVKVAIKWAGGCGGKVRSVKL